MTFRFSLFVVLVFSAPALRAQDGPDPALSLIVSFRPAAFALTEGGYTCADPELCLLLNGFSVQRAVPLIPGFKPGNAVVETSGGAVRVTDWSDTYVLSLPSSAARMALFAALAGHSAVVYSEPNTRGTHDGDEAEAVSVDAEPAPMLPLTGSALLTPNDAEFYRQWAFLNTGDPSQGGGAPDADVDGPEAWAKETGESWVKIAIVDDGIRWDHEDLTGRVTGDPTETQRTHGTQVAGVAAAQGNNTIGIAGMAWNVTIVNEDYEAAYPDVPELTGAIISAYNRGAHVINNSWRLLPTKEEPNRIYSATIRQALADAYRLGRTVVASMGNQSGNFRQYPAAHRQGVITVGATLNTDARAPYSQWGDWIDVTAPGGTRLVPGQPQLSRIYTTSLTGSYTYNSGTSFAAPLVSGLAALLISYRADLQDHPDDVEEIIERSAEDRATGGGTCTATVGFDPCFGWGRVNAYQALTLLDAPNVLTRGTLTGGGTVASVSAPYSVRIFNPNDNLTDGIYSVRRHEVHRTVSIGPYVTTPHAWGRGGGSTVPSTVGWGEETDPDGIRYTYGMPLTEVVSASASSLTLRTYVYEVLSVEGRSSLGFYPATPGNAGFAYTALGIPCQTKCSERGGRPADEFQTAFAVEGVTPNPLRGAAAVAVSLPAPADVTLTVHDALGREVARQAVGALDAGRHQIAFEAARLAPGVYLVRVAAGRQAGSLRVTVLR